MANTLFNKNLPKNCEYCAYGNPLNYEDQIICKKRGVTTTTDTCNYYKYDPLKRIPKKIKINKDYTENDFEI